VDWRLKGLVQKTLGYVPRGDHIHYILQKRFGGLRNFRRECAAKIEDWRLMIGHMREVDLPVAGTRMMEMGSGWYPTLPFCSYLGGIGEIHTFDLNRHMRVELAIKLAEVIGDHLDMIAEYGDSSRDEVGRRHGHLLRTLRSSGDVTEATEGCVHYHAPADARKTSLPDNSIDWGFSNSVLEHVPAEDIVACMRESMRVIKPGKFMFHSVNCGDHYAYNDRSINQLNYLRFSETQWRLWQNDFLWQNRIRAKEFIQMARDVGFEIIIDTTNPTEKKLDQLAQIPVHRDFSSRYTPEELCLTSVDFVGQKPGGDESDDESGGSGNGTRG